MAQVVTRRGWFGDALAVAIVLWGASCSSHGDVTGGQAPNSGPDLGTISGSPNGTDTGAVGLHLTIANGVHVNQLAWTLSNGTNSYSGTVFITDDAGHEAQSVEFVAGGILAGSGYVVTLYGSDSNGDPCEGISATVTVTAGATSSAIVPVTCTAPTDAAITADVVNGAIAVNAPVVYAMQAPFQCPGITGVGVSPAELMPPETASLTAMETGGDGGTTTLLWTSTCGTITNPTQASATFSCGATTGVCTVTLTVGLDGTGLDGGSVGQVCTGIANTTASETINCEAQCTTSANCGTPSLCLVPSCVSNRCVLSNAPQGTACSDSGGSICDGGGNCVVPSFDVVRVGSGSDAGAGLTAAVFIDQYNLSGGLVSTIALPTVAGASGTNQALTLIDNDVAEGDLTTSADGRFVVMAGHNYAPGMTISSGNCVGAFINSSGTVNTATVLPNALAAGGSIQTAVSNDGAELWVGGTATDTTGGLWYQATGTSGNVQLVSATSSTQLARWLGIAGGQLYGDSSGTSAGNGLFTVGSGLPTSGSPTLALLPGLPSGNKVSPFGFVFFDLNPAVPGLDTVYIADDRTSTGGGIGKFTLAPGDGGALTWSVSWTVGGSNKSPDGGAGLTGCRGLAGYATGNTVTLVASTGMGGDLPDSLVMLVDTGSGTPSPTVLATAATNETFRGVAVPPHP
ncbi:MAG: hypothetical protein ACLP1X_18400 [Polyangiaceae bacterium]